MGADAKKVLEFNTTYQSLKEHLEKYFPFGEDFVLDDFKKYHQNLEETANELREVDALSTFEIAKINALHELQLQILELKSGEKLNLLLSLYKRTVNLDPNNQNQLKDYISLCEQQSKQEAIQSFGGFFKRFFALVKQFFTKFNLEAKSDTYKLVDKLTRSVKHEVQTPKTREERILLLAKEMVTKFNSQEFDDATLQRDDRQRIELYQKANKLLGSIGDIESKDQMKRVEYKLRKEELEDFLITVEAMKDYLHGKNKLGQYLNYLDSPVEGIFQQDEIQLEILKGETRKQALERNPLMHILMWGGSVDHSDYPKEIQNKLDKLAKEIYRRYEGNKETPESLASILNEYTSLKDQSNKLMQEINSLEHKLFEHTALVEVLIQKFSQGLDIKPAIDMCQALKNLDFNSVQKTETFIASYLKEGKPCAVLLGDALSKDIVEQLKAKMSKEPEKDRKFSM